MTVEDLYALPDDGYHYELQAGEDVLPAFSLDVAELFEG